MQAPLSVVTILKPHCIKWGYAVAGVDFSFLTMEWNPTPPHVSAEVIGQLVQVGQVQTLV